MVSCRSTRSSFANEAVYRMHLPVLHTYIDVARISASPDGYRPRLERLHHRAAGHMRLSVRQKASHHCVRRRLPKRKHAEEVSSFVIPLTLDRQALQDGCLGGTSSGREPKGDYYIKMRLMVNYCNSLFGCILWNITNPAVEPMCTAWRTGVRRSQVLPLALSFCWLLVVFQLRRRL